MDLNRKDTAVKTERGNVFLGLELRNALNAVYLHNSELVEFLLCNMNDLLVKFTESVERNIVYYVRLI